MRYIYRAPLGYTGRVYKILALLKLHGFIFDGIRPDAGKLRTSSAELNGSSFADASLIAGSMKRLLGKLADTPL